MKNANVETRAAICPLFPSYAEVIAVQARRGVLAQFVLLYDSIVVEHIACSDESDVLLLVCEGVKLKSSPVRLIYGTYISTYVQSTEMYAALKLSE